MHRLPSGPFARTKEIVVMFAIVALPLLALYQAARQVGIFGVLSSDGITVRGHTAQGTEVVMTSYAPDGP
jgi:hypothetical protein